MKVQILYPDGDFTGKLKPSVSDFVNIKTGRYIHEKNSHPLISDKENYFHRVYEFDYDKKKIYYLNSFGNLENHDGTLIGLNWWQFHRFLWLQKKHWLQKEENLRYIVNLIFLAIGAYVGLNKL